MIDTPASAAHLATTVVEQLGGRSPIAAGLRSGRPSAVRVQRRPTDRRINSRMTEHMVDVLAVMTKDRPPTTDAGGGVRRPINDDDGHSVAAIKGTMVVERSRERAKIGRAVVAAANQG